VLIISQVTLCRCCVGWATRAEAGVIKDESEANWRELIIFKNPISAFIGSVADFLPADRLYQVSILVFFYQQVL
jgi:hypothetical protein